MGRDLGYRRIQCTGRGSYIISLPKEWVQNGKLQRGDQLAFEVQDNSSMLLIPRKILERKEEKRGFRMKEYVMLVDSKDTPQSVCRRITSLYAISADLIHVHFKGGEIPSEHKTAISGLSKSLLLGSEIISEKSNEITLQVLVNHPEFPIETAIRRMAILALSANRDAILALEKADETLAELVAETYKDVERLNLYVVRQLKYGLERNLFEELGFQTPKEFLGYRIVVNDIKGIADNALNIANNIAALRKMMKDQLLLLNEPIDEEMRSQISKFNSEAHYFFEETLRALFKRDYERADKLISEIKTLIAVENELVTVISAKKMDPYVSSIFRLILDGSRRIIEYGRNIAEVTLNRTVEEKSQLVHMANEDDIRKKA